MMIGLPFSSGKEATISKPFAEVAQLVRDAHHDVALDELRRALGVEGDEVERRAGLAGGVVRAVQQCSRKFAQELRRRWRSPGPVESAPPTRAVGRARFTASAE